MSVDLFAIYLCTKVLLSLNEFQTAPNLPLPVSSLLTTRNQETVLKSVEVLALAFLLCAVAKDLKDLDIICRSLGWKFPSAHNSLRSEMQKCDSLALLPLGHRSECLIKGCFLTPCLHPARLHALARRFCNLYHLFPNPRALTRP